MNNQKRKRGLNTMLIVIAGILILLGASVAGGFAVMKHEYGDRTELMKSTAGSSEKVLVVYQPSISPASSDVAHAIAKGLNEAGMEVLLSNPGKHLTTDISPFSILVFGSPNYGGSVAEPLTEYVKKIDDFSGKTVLLYSTSGGVGIMPELEKLAGLLRDVKPYSMSKFQFQETEKNQAIAYQLGKEVAGH